MSFIACPHCHEKIGFGPIDAVPTELPRPKRQTNGQITPLRTKVLEDVHETIKAIGPGRHTNQELWLSYVNIAQARGAQPITSHALSMALSAYGLERWRTKSRRGWVIPANPPELIGIDPKAKERLAAESYRQTIAVGGPEKEKMLGAPPNAPAPREDTVALEDPLAGIFKQPEPEVPERIGNMVLGPYGWMRADA